jgi:cytochrome P450
LPGPNTEARRIPPGPNESYDPGGHLLHWLGDQFQRFGNTYRASIYGASVYVTRDPQHAQHVLRDNWRNYKKGLAIKRVALLLGNGLMVSEGEFWKAQRRKIQPLFHRKVIGSVIGDISAANVALLKKWKRAAAERTSVNVTRDVSRTILDIILIVVFGPDYEKVLPYSNILCEETARDLSFAQAFKSLGEIVAQIAAQRRSANPVSTDLLGMLIEARDERGQPMPDQQLVNEVKTLIVAGHETTASTLNWTWYLLSQHPNVEQKLSCELEEGCAGESLTLEALPKFVYTRRVLEEVLRLYPAGWLLTRRALKDDWLGDYFVPSGTEIYISPYFIQRHPEIWSDPDRFIPDRFAPERSRERQQLAMLPFSTGPRTCVGEVLARVEMQLHLMIIAKELRLDFIDRQIPEFDAEVNLRSKHDFIMVPALKVRP